MTAWNDHNIDAPLQRLPGHRTLPTEAIRDEPWYNPACEACDDAELIALQDGSLEEERATEVQLHLAECRACRDLLVQLGQPVPQGLAPSERGGTVVPLWRRPSMLVAPVLAAAAAGAGMVWLGKGPIGPPEVPLPPAYQVGELLGGVQAVRGHGPDAGAPAASPERLTVFVPAGRVELTVAPVTDLQGPVPAARGFVVRADGPLEPLAVSLQQGEGGVWFLDAPARRVLGPGFGRRTLVVALASRPKHLAGLAGIGLPRARAQATGVRWLTLDLDYRSTRPGAAGSEAPKGP